MAMVVLLSVFNGFEGLIKTMYRSFDPDLAIMPARGQVFATDSVARRAAPHRRSARGVLLLDGNALLEYRGISLARSRRRLALCRGRAGRSMTVEGQYRLRFGDMPEAFVGQGVASALGVRTGLSSPITVYVPRRGRVSPLLPYSFYRQQQVFPSGVFALEAEIDGEYVFVPLDFAQRLFDYSGRASAAAVRLAEGASAARVKEAVAERLGDDFRILTRYEQKESFYRIMAYEKWGIYFIILLVLLVASFSLIGSLAMLIIDKRKDMRTLMTLGADVPLLRRIFVSEGMMVYLLGAAGGLALGLALALGQQHFGWLKLSGQTFLLDAYPVEVHAADLAWITVTFVAMSYLISSLTVRAMIPRREIKMEENV
ncbi:MAG: ABC transporter permease [Alistipes sp.]